jgi:hypothetical protein
MFYYLVPVRSIIPPSVADLEAAKAQPKRGPKTQRRVRNGTFCCLSLLSNTGSTVHRHTAARPPGARTGTATEGAPTARTRHSAPVHRATGSTLPSRPGSMGSGVSSSMALALAGFCFSVLFIVFVCTRLACALVRRRRRQARARLAAAPPLPHYAHGYADPDPFPSFRAARHHHHAPGLDPAAFPTRAYAAAQASDSDDGSQ